jgi:hypothetical protein
MEMTIFPKRVGIDQWVGFVWCCQVSSCGRERKAGVEHERPNFFLNHS